jgi:hypothetical protein
LLLGGGQALPDVEHVLRSFDHQAGLMFIDRWVHGDSVWAGELPAA